MPTPRPLGHKLALFLLIWNGLGGLVLAAAAPTLSWLGVAWEPYMVTYLVFGLSPIVAAFAFWKRKTYATAAYGAWGLAAFAAFLLPIATLPSLQSRVEVGLLGSIMLGGLLALLGRYIHAAGVAP